MWKLLQECRLVLKVRSIVCNAQELSVATFPSVSWNAQAAQSASIASLSSWAKSTRSFIKHCRIMKDRQCDPEVICIRILYAAPLTYVNSYMYNYCSRLTRLVQ